MDSNSHFQLQQNQSNSGLLRFRSAPSHVLSNLKRGEGGGASNPNEDSESQRVVLRFLNSSETDSPSSLREFVDINNKPSASKSASPLSRMNSQLGNGSSSSFVHTQFQRYSSMGMDQRSKSFNSNLLRQSSFRTAAENFSNNISFQNGYDNMKGVGNYGGVNGSDGELSLSMNRLKNQINFSSREGIGATQLNGELGNQIHHTLSHHFSLPRESSEIFAMGNMLHLPDSVPCKIRARRGFATHPRSIAERERRTRISERIRKLQELVPNMDKQTSTAEMLDLAVGYIKDLQKQYKSLSEKRARCKCISMKKLETNQVS